ncbi:MAG: O-methyltransferase, partial [Frisingicoccus sp.]|nr:O-methyltransferase [Frisingicoccus sp.]
MIVDERMLDYILSLDKDESPLIRTIEQEAIRDYVPIIRKESRSLLRVLLRIKKPGRVLEVGTAIGFSAILMGECLPKDSHLTTIEKYEKRIPIARENFKRAG